MPRPKAEDRTILLDARAMSRALQHMAAEILELARGSAAARDDGIVQEAVQIAKRQAPELLVITDLCFCEYTDHGHCGPLTEAGGRLDVDNDATLPLLAEQAVSHARAGADLQTRPRQTVRLAVAGGGPIDAEQRLSQGHLPL